MRDGVAARLRPLLGRILGADPPIRVRAWDGSESGPPDAPCFVIRHRRALRRLLWKPGELGLARAYVAGELDIEGDLIAALAAVQELMRLRAGQIRLSSDDKREIVRTAVMLGAVGPEPRPPVEEHTWTRAVTRHGPAGSAGATTASGGGRGGREGGNGAGATRAGDPARDGAAVEHAAAPGRGRLSYDAVAAHADDLGTDFFRRVLGTELTATCGDWSGIPAGHGLGGVPEAVEGAGPHGAPGRALDAAQRAGYERVARLLELRPGMRILDVACGWGSFARYAAAHHDVHVVGHTISSTQAWYGAELAAEAGLAGRVDIVHHPDAVSAAGPYDAIVALTAAEAATRDGVLLRRLLRPGGRLLVRRLSRLGGAAGGSSRRTFTSRYILAGEGRPVPLGTAVSHLEEAGLEVRDVRSLREDYARTLRAWTANLQAHWDECATMATPGRSRVWLLYLAATALACEGGRLGLHEILSTRPFDLDHVTFPSGDRIDVRT